MFLIKCRNNIELGIGVVTFNKRLGFLDGSANKEERAFLEASKVAFEQLHMSMSGKSLLHKLYRNKTYRIFEQAISVIKRCAFSCMID